MPDAVLGADRNDCLQSNLNPWGEDWMGRMHVSVEKEGCLWCFGGRNIMSFSRLALRRALRDMAVLGQAFVSNQWTQPCS